MASRTRRIRYYTWAMLVIGVGLIVQATVELSLMRRDAWATAAESSRNLHRTLRERLADLFGRRDAAMLDIIEVLGRPEIGHLPEEVRQRVLFGRPDRTEEGNGTLVIGADGYAATSSYSTVDPRNFLGERAYFAVHRDDPDHGLYVGAPIMTYRSRAMSIPISRRLNGPDRSFAGVVVSMVTIERINRLIADIELGENGVIALFRQDGTLLTRMPPLPAGVTGTGLGEAAIARAAAGADRPFLSISAIDGVRRHYTPGQVPEFKLELHIGRSLQAIEADWQLRAALVTLSLLGSLLLLFIATRLVEAEIQRRQKSEAALIASEAHYRAILHHASDTIALIEAGGRASYVSPAAERLIGATPEALVGRRLLRHVFPECRPRVLAAMRGVWQGAPQTSVFFRMRHANGRIVWVESVMVRSDRGVVTVSRDVTAKKAEETALARLVYQDPLTGLANRRGFDAALTAAWETCAILHQPLALLLVDIDHFKQLNDSMGHQAGDAALRVVGAKLRGALRRDSDTAARIGGDELALLLPGMDQNGAFALAERLHKTLAGPPHPPVSTSIGAVSVYPELGSNGKDRLLATADAALYRAKRAGRGRVAA